MSDTAEKKTTAADKPKIAQEPLYAGWAIAYAEGDEVPADVLKSDLAKEYDWASKVKS